MGPIVFHAGQGFEDQLPFHFPQGSIGLLRSAHKRDGHLLDPFRRTMFRQDRTLAGQQQGPFHHVFQLAHVSLPGQPLQMRQCAVRQGRRRHAVSRGRLIHKMTRQQRDIGDALTQRRHRHGKNVQPVIQIFAKAALLHLPIEDAVRRGDDANVDRNRIAPADPIHFAFLQDAQEFRLKRQVHFADLVQEQGARMRHLELSDFADNGAGKRAPLMAEEFALQQSIGERGTVHRNEGPMGPRAPEMDEPRQQLFACTAFTVNEHGGLAGGHAFDRAQQSHHPRVLAEQRPVLHLMDGLTGSNPFLTACFEIGDRPFQHVHGKRLQQILAGPEFHGLDGRLNRPVGRHEDDRRLRSPRLHFLDQIETGQAGHTQIRQDQPRPELGESLQCLRSIRRPLHGIAESPDGFHQGDAHRRIIVDHQNPFLFFAGFRRRGLLLTVSHKTIPP